MIDANRPNRPGRLLTRGLRSPKTSRTESESSSGSELTREEGQRIYDECNARGESAPVAELRYARAATLRRASNARRVQERLRAEGGEMFAAFGEGGETYIRETLEDAEEIERAIELLLLNEAAVRGEHDI